MLPATMMKCDHEYCYPTLVATTLPGPWWDQVHAQARQAVFPQHGRALQDRQQDLGKDPATDGILSISTNAFTL